MSAFLMKTVSENLSEIRNSFEIKKYIISKSLCPALVDMIKNDAPWYTFNNLMDIESAFKSTIYAK